MSSLPWPLPLSTLPASYDSPQSRIWKLAIHTIVTWPLQNSSTDGRNEPTRQTIYQQNSHVLGYIVLDWKFRNFTQNLSYTQVNIEV